MTKPLLTIGIPTYKRPECLASLLAEIVPACEARQVEVLVSSNSADEATKQVLEKFAGYKYFQANINQVNLEFDRNILVLLTKARGSFLWLLADDDVMNIARLDELLGLINDQPETGLFYLSYKYLDGQGYPAPGAAGLRYSLISQQEYLDKLLHKGTLISTNIINLNYYRAMSLNSACIGQGWIHLHIFLNLADFLALRQIKNIAVEDIMVQQRTGNVHHTLAQFSDLFIYKFLFTLEHSTTDNISLAKFKENFFKLNVKSRLFCLGEGLDFASFQSVFRLAAKNFVLSPLDKLHFFLANIGLRGIVHLTSILPGRR